MLQMFGCVCRQTIGAVCWQTFGCVGQFTTVQAIPTLGHGGAKVGCGQPGCTVWIWQPSTWVQTAGGD
jgi:hypothetical protein